MPTLASKRDWSMSICCFNLMSILKSVVYSSMNKLEQSTLAVVFKNGGQNWFIWSLVKITPASARGKWFTVPDHQSVGDTLEPVLAVEMQSTGFKVGTESKKGGKGL